MPLNIAVLRHDPQIITSAWVFFLSNKFVLFLPNKKPYAFPNKTYHKFVFFLPCYSEICRADRFLWRSLCSHIYVLINNTVAQKYKYETKKANEIIPVHAMTVHI
jgi:hypothetical protein